MANKQHLKVGGQGYTKKRKNETCGTLQECFTLAAQVSAAGRCSIPHLPCTFMCAWRSHAEASWVFLGLTCKALHANLYKWSCLSHPFLPCFPAPDYVTQMGRSQEEPAFPQGCLDVQSAVGGVVLLGTGSGSPWKPCARHSCMHLIPESGIVLPALQPGEIKQRGVHTIAASSVRSETGEGCVQNMWCCGYIKSFTLPEIRDKYCMGNSRGLSEKPLFSGSW